jgi:hypothetical protein
MSYQAKIFSNLKILFNIKLKATLIVISLLGVASHNGLTQTIEITDPVDRRIERLEQTLEQVLSELKDLKAERDQIAQQAEVQREQTKALEEQQQAMLEEMELQEEALALAPKGSSILNLGNSTIADPIAPPVRPGLSRNSLPAGLMIGAYGEHHFNFTEGSGGDQSDIHRFVAFLGYQFSDWIYLNTETEIEHAFVSDSDGELSLEQFFFDFSISNPLNIRIGRSLHPAGIVNRYHEPTTFNGTERPTYSQRILPSTWSIDGIGAWGRVTDWLSYESYLHAGLDGSQFSGGSGIRGGRIKERPSLNDIGFSSRLDFYPLIAANSETEWKWRSGVSYSNIGVENGDQGRNAGRPNDNLQIFSLDTQLSWRDWDFRTEASYIDNPAAFNSGVGGGTSDEIFGAYVELGYHFWPDAWMRGKLENSDAVAFVRYEYIDPQYGTTMGGTSNRNQSLRETTIGIGFYPMPRIVIKADYTFVESLAADVVDRMAFGVGYAF